MRFLRRLPGRRRPGFTRDRCTHGLSLVDAGRRARRHHTGRKDCRCPACVDWPNLARLDVSQSVDLTPCDQAPDRLCGSVEVPLDRSDPTGTQVPIHFEIFPHWGQEPVDEAILVTQGGPGVSATQDPFFGSFLSEQFDPMLERRDLILLDQRGIGLSQAIDCPTLQRETPEDIYASVADCGSQLGETSSLYGSGDVALDIEAVRRALGIEKLDFYGGSYATVDIQAYAARFPGHLRSVVLDSPVTIVGFDPFFESSARAITRTARLVCERSASCSADHHNAAKDLEWLAKRLRKHPIDGVGNDAAGNPHNVHVSEGFLVKIADNDSGGFIGPGEIAAAAHSLRHHDPEPLLRLAAENDFDIFEPESDDPAIFSVGDSWARSCSDLSFPWDKNAPIAQRRAQWEDAVDDREKDDFEPFSVGAWLAPLPLAPFPDPCIVWPAPVRPVEPAVPAGTKFAHVPALVLSGDLDANTTTPDAKKVAALFPRSSFVELANSGHHTLTNARFDCAAAIIIQFVRRLKQGDTSCASSNEFVFPAVGRFPEKASDAGAAKKDRAGNDHSKKKERRVAAVAVATIMDAFRRSFLSLPNGVGLRGGSFTTSFSDAGVTIDLTGARFAEDVAVSGTSFVSFAEQSILDATVTVDGPGAEDGTLNVTGIAFSPGATTFQVRGTLGGRTVAVLVPAT